MIPNIDDIPGARRGSITISGHAKPMPNDWLLLSPQDENVPAWDVKEGDIIDLNRSSVQEEFRVMQVFEAGGVLVAPIKDGGDD